ncbi:alpha/beta fold hydrolase [Amycolatopsis acidiphila]|uniref:Alpha/beta fold hydrolase n=1 Tax=Amycolatopsis acidiphila TaxID=715473 RepID=A0A558A0Q3_9PSEU|nr:alpha/beta fold hydrolase [Amycolatopsis acidiphila]TVT17839.1 alpha/beta fold hydrolase [Amycolatopsis acidiphila]UIJ62230.1 alpha/beta fold hydrolase [Amycolatopsis acidiphila]GHG92756.1 ABC transporter ATP-binding protein [Amycolatopsis acidiphila]
MPRIPLPHTRRARLLTLGVVVVILAAVGVVWAGAGRGAAPVASQDGVLDVPAAPGSAQQVHLDTTLFLPARTPAPALLLPHGFGADKTSVASEAQELARRGFVVLTWSARGFGHSTGQIGLNDPDLEVADASHLVDYLAKRPEVRLDGPDDPRIGVVGASYGGALALLLAGQDKRIDAISPEITYNDLAQGLVPNAASATAPAATTPAAGAFAPDGVFKRSWAGILFSAGSSSAGGSGGLGTEAPEPGQETDDSSSQSGSGGGAAAGAPAQLPSADSVCGRFTAQICQAYTELATTGRATPATVDLLRRLSPASVTSRITAPTLLVQGETDTLFGLDQSDATARQIAAAGGKVQQIWYAGGHDGGQPGPQLRAKVADWLWFQLTGEGANPVTGFSYDVQGSLRASGAPSVRIQNAPDYPGITGDATQRSSVALRGGQQTIINPPGGAPAAVSGIPGLNGLAGSARLSGLFGIDPPGESARFTTAPVDSQLLVAGSPTIRLRVAGSTPDAVLFVKLYDVSPDGTRTLPANAVAPVRVPLTGGPAEVTVTLAGIVRPIESGHSLQVVVTTTDQAYTTPIAPAAYQVSIDGGVSVPVIPGTAVGSGWPVGSLLGIAGILLAALVVAILAALRRRRSHRADPALADVPLVIEGLTKAYRGGVTAVRDLSFRVEPGQVLGLLGPNGAGKTTTLRMLMGLITPTTGQIRVFGYQVSAGAPVLSRIGSFVEGSGFLPHLSGELNLRLYWDATGRPAERAHFAEALEIAGLGDAVHRKVRTYSQGMRQRLAIAQAMLGLPELLVLDEPTNGLDPPQIHQMREVLQRYAATGRTVVVSSHLLAEVEQTCTHVVVMHRGALVASGEVGDIAAAGGEATFRVDDPEAAASALRSVGGVSEVDIEGDLVHADLDGLPRAEAVAALVRAGVAVEQAGPRRRLEDAFLRLVGDGE